MPVTYGALTYGSGTYGEVEAHTGITLHPGWPPGTACSSYRFEDVEPWVRDGLVPPESFVIDTAVVATDYSVTIEGIAGIQNVLRGVVRPLFSVPQQRFVSFLL